MPSKILNMTSNLEILSDTLREVQNVYYALDSYALINLLHYSDSAYRYHLAYFLLSQCLSLFVRFRHLRSIILPRIWHSPQL